MRQPPVDVAARGVMDPLMRHDPEFPLQSIPLAEWLQEDDVEQIPWDVEIQNTGLRMDQRLEIAYAVWVGSRELNRLGPSRELVFIAGLQSPEGQPLSPAKVVRQRIPEDVSRDIDLRFSDWVFVQPGEYVLWLALYEPETERRSIARRSVRVEPIADDPLPESGLRMPYPEIPLLSDREGGRMYVLSNGLHFPVHNQRPIRVELVSILSPPPQWIERGDIIRLHRRRMATAVNTLSQLELAEGAISATGIDVVERAVLLEQRAYDRLDQRGLLDALYAAEGPTISLDALEGRAQTSAFVHDVLRKRIDDSSGMPCALIVISSSFVFDRGVNLRALPFEGALNCSVYHLRFRHRTDDVFDDIGRALDPLRPKTFNIGSPMDFRRALAEIIRNLENL